MIRSVLSCSTVTSASCRRATPPQGRLGRPRLAEPSGLDEAWLPTVAPRWRPPVIQGVLRTRPAGQNDLHNHVTFTPGRSRIYTGAGQTREASLCGEC